MKPREFWIGVVGDPNKSSKERRFVYLEDPLRIPDEEVIHVREVCPEREAAIEKMIEALENYRDNIKILDGGRMILCPSTLTAIEALEAWRKANE